MPTDAPQPTAATRARRRARSWRPLLAALLAALLASGCGFQLRGTSAVPPELNPLYIQGGEATATGQALIDRLQGSAVRVTEDRGEARVVVRILDERRDSRVAAVDRNGKVLAYELSLRVRFDALGAEGGPLVPAQPVALFRTLDNPDIEVLGKQQETRMTYRDMEAEAAERVLLRLSAALR